MKRVYYIANSYDGAYFVFTDNIEEYFNRLAAYAMNLQASKKTNHYTFGSLEVSQEEYEAMSEEATAFESSLIKEKEKPSIQLAETEEEEKAPLELVSDAEKEQKKKRPHLRLV